MRVEPKIRSFAATLVPVTAIMLSATTILVSCADDEPHIEVGALQDASVADIVDSDTDLSAADIVDSDTDLPADGVASIEVVASTSFLEVGDALQLEAVARDSGGQDVEGVEFLWMSSNPTRLPVDEFGLVTASEEGLFNVYAVAEDIYSEPIFLHVSPILDTTTRTVTAHIEITESIGDRELVIVTGLGSTPVEPDEDGNAELTVLASSNQAAFASDPETGTPLLIKIFRGENEDFGPDDQAMNMYSTAEALLLLTPGIAHPSPYYVESVRSLMADGPELEQLAAVLEDLSVDGGFWADHMDVVQYELAKVREAFYERLEPLLTVSEEEEKSLQVLSYPDEQDGLGVITTPCTESVLPECQVNPENRVVVEVQNHHVRYVNVRFQPADPEAYPNAVVPPQTMIDAATVMQGFWQAIWNLREFSLGFASPSSVTCVLRLDPSDRGAPRWHILTYGPGFNAPSTTIQEIDPDWASRLIGPWLRTYIFEIGFNLWSIIDPSNGPQSCEEDLKTLIKNLENNVQLINEIVNQVQGNDEIDDIFIGNVVSRGMEYLIECGARILTDSSRLSALIGTQVLTVLADIIRIWDVTAALVQIASVYIALFEDSSVSLFTISGEEEDIHPRTRWLPAAPLGCPYSTQLYVVPTAWLDDPTATFSWSVGFDYEGWWATPMGNQEQWLTIDTNSATDAILLPNQDHGEVFVSVDTSWGFSLSDTFYLPVNEPVPLIEAYEWIDPGDGFPPGATAELRVDASTCLELGRNIDSGTVDGVVITGITPLNLQENQLVGNVTLISPVDDAVTYELTATAITEHGQQMATNIPIQVGNAAPVVAGPFLYRLAPGATFYPQITVWDDNYVGTNLSEIPVSHVATPNQSVELDTTPLAIDLTYQRATTPPELGDGLTFGSRTYLRVSSPHPDNDGTTGSDTEALENALTITIEVTDDNGAVGAQAGHDNATIAIVVNNVAPVITGAPDRLVVWDEGPAEIPVVVADDNGIADIDGVQIVGPNYGMALADASNVGDTRVFRFETTSLDLPEECDPECSISFQAIDADDVSDNGGLSDVFDVQLQQDPGPSCEDNGDCPEDQYCWANGYQCDADAEYCQDRPLECPAVELGDSLECGCDGNTYLSRCLAKIEGVTPEIGGDPSVCTATECTANTDCLSGSMCLFPEGQCGGTGTCVVSPPECATSTPVCGCDGQTHADYCEAVRAGVSVLSPGTCGQTCSDFRDCAYGQTCYKVAGDCFGQGVCAQIEATCDEETSSTVCGCDGQAYDCTVAALSAFTSVAHTGACVACTPANGAESGCGEGEVCKTTDGCDEPGVCVPVEPDCDQEVDDPVCGCDGMLHENACVATLHSVALSSDDDRCACDSPENVGGSGDDGSLCPELSYCDRLGCVGSGYCTPSAWLDCESETDVCCCDGTIQDDLCDAEFGGLGAANPIVCSSECRADVDCPIGQFCEFSTECGGNGECRARPSAETCTPTPEVCGCDGVTYSSDCLRQSWGVSKGYDGACATCDPSSAIDCDNPLHVCARRIAYCSDALGEGACIVTPLDYDDCDDRYAPFCDCEYTFQNVCHAEFFSYLERPYQALTIPADETELGGCLCDDDTTCFSPDGGTFCLRDEIGCTGPGVCVFPEQLANMTWGPGAVCGCDANSYSNRGDAYAAGVNIAYEGACGDTCDLDRDCVHIPNGYCELAFGTCGGIGTCRAKLTASCGEAEPRPVCGCNGVRYPSPCAASEAGVSVAHLGECQPCNGYGACDDFTQACTWPIGQCEPVSPDRLGACIDRPIDCPDDFDPVCSCNGITYESLCEARNAEQNIRNVGYCTCSAGSDSVPCIQCIYGEQPSCADDWTDDCEAVGLGACLDECRCPDFCCQAQDHAGCDIPACEECVGALRPSCRTDLWDAECVQLAATTCDASCPCLGDACEVHDLPGTQSSRCWSCVCTEDATCCSASWHEGCVELAHDECQSLCGCSGPCCEPHEDPGCNDDTCETAVCDEMASCCASGWDAACAAVARRVCPALCPSGSCCEAHDGLGCNDSTCETTVCGAMPTCCSDNWTASCADEAATACSPLCNQDSCCIPSDAAGCTDSTCETAVCTIQSSCCDTVWDASCAALAESTCAVLCEPQSCCEVHSDTLGCDNATCESAVCAESSACCTEGWSSDCATAAETLCPTICEPAMSCGPTSDCPDGFFCDGGVCVDGTTLTPCSDSVDCSPGQYCDGSYCRTP